MHLAQDVGVCQDGLIVIQEYTHNVMPIRYKCFVEAVRFVLMQ